MLDIRQLSCFVAVAEDLHFGKASDRLGVAQSALSTQIQKLEKRVGVRLFDRNKRQRISLTSAGQLLLVEAVATMRHARQAEEVGVLAARGLAGVVRIGYVASAVTTGVLTNMLRNFRATHERVAVNVLAMETPKQLEAIANGDIDIGILRPRRLYPDGVRATVVHSERLLVALPDDHRLARSVSVKAADLKDERFVSPHFGEPEGFSEVLAKLGEAGGFSIGNEYRVNDFITAVSLAAAGYGVVVVPESIRQFGQPGVIYKSIRDFKDNVELALVARRQVQSAVVKALVALAFGVKYQRPSSEDPLDSASMKMAVPMPRNLRSSLPRTET